MEEKSKAKKLGETVEKASAAVDGANNALSTVKWVAIAVVVLTLAGAGYGIYKVVSAPVVAVGSAVGSATDVAKSGAEKVKQGSSELINRLVIPSTNQDELDMVADAAFAALTKMKASKPSGVKDRMYRAKNFSGNGGKVCALSLDFGSGAVPIMLAADNDDFETAKALGSNDNRLIRMIIQAGNDVAMNVEWDEGARQWGMKWRATTVKKSIGDDVAEERILDVLTAAKTGC